MNKTQKNIKIKKNIFFSKKFRKNKSKKGGSSPSSLSSLSKSSLSSHPSIISSSPSSSVSPIRPKIKHSMKDFKVVNKKTKIKDDIIKKINKLFQKKNELEVKLLSCFKTKEDKEFINILLDDDTITSENYSIISKIKKINNKIEDLQKQRDL